MEEITAKEMDNWKATPQDNVFLNISNGAPLQDDWPTALITTESLLLDVA